MKRQHENLISNGIQHTPSTLRRPLRYDDQHSPSVIGRPENIREIVSLWGRIKAAWAVLTLNAYATRWYNHENAHLWRPDYWESVRGNVAAHDDYMRTHMLNTQAH